MSILQQRVRAAIKQHGGVEKAATALGVNIATVSMLADGKRKSASPKTLRKFGLRKHLTHREVGSDRDGGA